MAYMNSVCRACLTTKASFTYFIYENVCPDTYCFCTSIEVRCFVINACNYRIVFSQAPTR